MIGRLIGPHKAVDRGVGKRSARKRDQICATGLGHGDVVGTRQATYVRQLRECSLNVRCSGKGGNRIGGLGDDAVAREVEGERQLVVATYGAVHRDRLDGIRPGSAGIQDGHVDRGRGLLGDHPGIRRLVEEDRAEVRVTHELAVVQGADEVTRVRDQGVDVSAPHRRAAELDREKAVVRCVAGRVPGDLHVRAQVRVRGRCAGQRAGQVAEVI